MRREREKKILFLSLASFCSVQVERFYNYMHNPAEYCSNKHTFCPYAGNIFALKTLDSNKKMENIYKIWYVCRSRSFFQRFFFRLRHFLLG